MKNLIYILVFVLFTSCLGSKKVMETNKSTTEKQSSEVVKDSTTNTETNAEIKDRIVINVPETDNTEVMEMFTSVLRRLNTSKSSGSNSYQMRYDEETKELIADIKVAATEMQKTRVTSDSKIEKSFEQTTDEYISKKVKLIPWWFWIGIIVWFLPQITDRAKLIINPLQSLFKK